MPPLFSTLKSRSLLPNDVINIAFGVLASVVGIIGVILAWAVWRVQRGQERRPQDGRKLLITEALIDYS